MQVKAKTSFVHGIYSMHRGDEINMPDGIAADLERAGLVGEVDAKQAPTPENKMAPATKNKAKSK